MGAYFDLYLCPQRPSEPYDESRIPVTTSRVPRLAEMMLFAPDCATLIDSLGADLVSDRASALARFGRRLPEARAALAWDLPARRALDAFNQFLAATDVPFLHFDTSEPRSYLKPEENLAFDRELACVLAALDRPAVARRGALYGGEGRLSSDWERVLTFCRWNVEAIYSGQPDASRPATGTAHLLGNPYARLLAAHLPQRGRLTIPHLRRARDLLALTPDQDKHWASLEKLLRDIIVIPDWAGYPVEVVPFSPEEIRFFAKTFDDHPLTAMLSRGQLRTADRLRRAMGVPPRGART